MIQLILFDNQTKYNAYVTKGINVKRPAIFTVSLALDNRQVIHLVRNTLI
jgi:hypothetical protein